METNNETPNTGDENKGVVPETVEQKSPATEYQTEEVGSTKFYYAHGDTFTPPVKEEAKTPESEPSSLKEENTETPKTETQEKTVSETPVEETTTETVAEEEGDFVSLTPDEIAAKLNEAVAEYGFETFEEARAFKTTDFTDHSDDGVTEEETIIQSMILKDPAITDVEIEVFFDKFSPLFMSDEEIAAAKEAAEFPTDKEYRQLEADYLKLTREAEAHIQEEQEKINLEGIGIKLKAEKPVSQNTGVTPEQQAQTKEAVVTTLKGVNDTFRITDKDGKELATVPFALEEGDVESAAKAAYDFPKRWSNPDGTVNLELFSKEMHYLANREKIHSVIYSHGLNAGREEQVKDINNINFDKSTPPPAVTGKKSAAEQYGLI